MATFTNLYHASEAIRQTLINAIASIPSSSIVVAPPPEAVTPTEEIRISLMWVNEQATHRNDPPHRNYDGTRTPPPASLSMSYLVTTYGEANQNADGAHRLLGDILRCFHDAPIVEFPVPGIPGNSGEGKLQVVLVPITPELMEKLFSPLQIKHRPYLLYEVSPVQLVSGLDEGAPSPVVAPGGIALAGPTPKQRPTIERVAPLVQAEGGFLRIDGVFGAAIDVVWVGGTRIDGALLTIVDAQRSVRAQLPTGGSDAVLPGVHKVTVASGTLHSDAAQVQVVPAGSWTLDGPATLTHSQVVDLVLTGQGLDSTDLVHVWPDAGIFAPSDVRSFGPSAVTPTSVTVALSPPVPPGTYRIAARIDLGPGVAKQFTPFVVLEVLP